jgi:hypothetical protein
LDYHCILFPGHRIQVLKGGFNRHVIASSEHGRRWVEGVQVFRYSPQSFARGPFSIPCGLHLKWTTPSLLETLSTARRSPGGDYSRSSGHEGTGVEEVRVPERDCIYDPPHHEHRAPPTSQRPLCHGTPWSIMPIFAIKLHCLSFYRTYNQASCHIHHSQRALISNDNLEIPTSTPPKPQSIPASKLLVPSPTRRQQQNRKQQPPNNQFPTL